MFKGDTCSLFKIVSKDLSQLCRGCYLDDNNLPPDRYGDKISLFGFSRGAYTARALAGMIQRVGLLPADNLQQIPFAWNMYIRGESNKYSIFEQFLTFSMSPIKMTSLRRKKPQNTRELSHPM